jgi:hypothetical protein
MTAMSAAVSSARTSPSKPRAVSAASSSRIASLAFTGRPLADIRCPGTSAGMAPVRAALAGTANQTAFPRTGQLPRRDLVRW